MFVLKDGVELYSFDLFDTLVTRSVKSPDLIFKILEKSDIVYRSFFFEKIGFHRLRIISERIARKISKKNEEIDVFDVYRVLSFFVKNPADCLRRELELELELIVPIPENIESFKEIAKYHTCCITSDMYLTRSIIKRVIKKNIGDYNFFVSSSLDMTKHVGTLYKYLSEFYNVGYSNIKHFGDNEHADYKIPKKMGIEAQLIKNFNSVEKSKITSDFFKKNCPSIYSEIGFDLVGPSAWAFAKFIGDDAVNRGIKKIVFTARDCYLFKDIFDKLYPNIKTYYLRVSRRALYVPSYFVNKNTEKFFEGNVGAKEFFNRIGMPCPDNILHKIPNENKELFIDSLAGMGFDKYAHDEYVNLINYLRSNGFDEKSEKVGFVDLGWRCSMQSAISSILNNEFDIHGYYFGTVVKNPKHSSFYFKYTRPIKNYSQIYQALPLFEFLFTEPVYTVKRVRAADEAGYQFDFIYDESQDQLEIRKLIEVGAKCFFENHLKLANLSFVVNDDFDLNFLYKKYEKYLTNPSNNTIDALSSINHSEGFGGSQQSSILDLKNKNSLSDYKKSFWRSAYAKKSGGIFFLLHRAIYSQFGLFLLFKKRSLIEMIKNLKW